MTFMMEMCSKRPWIPKSRPLLTFVLIPTLPARNISTVSCIEPQVEELGGKAYTALKDFIYDQENAEEARRMRVKRRLNGRRHSSSALSDFVFFKDVMQRVQDTDGDGAAQWVLKDVGNALAIVRHP